VETYLKGTGTTAKLQREDNTNIFFTSTFDHR